jgi:hypothetical protein
MKICTKCKIEKDLDGFHKHKASKDGLRTICKKCRIEQEKNYYIKNNVNEKVREKRKTDKSYLEINTKYRQKNKEKVQKLKKEWSKSESGKKSKKKYYEKNSLVLKEKVKKNRESKIEIYKEKEKERRLKSEYKENQKFLQKKHREKYPHIYAWRSILTNSLKRLKTKKSGHTIEVLGYSAEDLKSHLESLFNEGMTWDNYGEWHIDHIKPVSLFEKDEDPKIVNALENLQPLWASENLSKSNKYN